LLQPGLNVLDVGCGTGSITAGIARAVGPAGQVIGIDRDESLLDIARNEHATISNLRFQAGDATCLPHRGQFDIVTSARCLQWIAQPERAVASMTQAAKPGGLLVILDYNHAGSEWQPEPPPEFKQFYSALLAWREANGWDNDMGDHLPEIFQRLGLVEIETHVQDETTERGDPDFAERTGIWSEVIESLSKQLIEAGYSTQSQLEKARECYQRWAEIELMHQTLALRAVTGKVP